MKKESAYKLSLIKQSIDNPIDNPMNNPPAGSPGRNPSGSPDGRLPRPPKPRDTATLGTIRTVSIHSDSLNKDPVNPTVPTAVHTFSPDLQAAASARIEFSGKQKGYVNRAERDTIKK